MFAALKKMFDPSGKELKRLRDTADRINALEPEIERLTDDELRAKTGEFKERLRQGAALDDLLPEAFACVREAAKRTLGQRHYDTQIMAGIVLHEGRIAEMKTGEGKTLAATLPVYLNALTGRGVHVVTVNDYLAKRDAEWMGNIYRFLGLSVGVIVPGLNFEERRQAYAADVTYGTNNEFGFDYLRDNMVVRPEQMVQRDLVYAIVDEVDSILIDEARTPLIISGQAQQSTEHYYRFAQIVPRLKRDEDYTVDEKTRQVAVTEEGVAKVEKMLGIDNLYDEDHFELVHYLHQALKAHTLFKRDRDYVVKDGEVIIVDEFTGRLMIGRRYSDGLHQAIEAKEGVKIEHETQTLASITFQNYFRMYEKLAGMTGTAKTEEAEFVKIYGMDVVVLPTHKPMIREDLPDLVFKTQEAKYKAVVEDIVELHRTGRPVLVGTASIERSEMLSNMLRRRGVPHQVLNAKYHEKEAEIVAQAGRKGAVTIATNMAGRGTDIMLGGNPEFLAKQELKGKYPPEVLAVATERTPTDDPEVLEAREAYRAAYAKYKEQCDREREEVVALGGLFIIGTERHESLRIDNQLRGRAGRQGDPGASRFYVSLEDDLMRLFGSERISGLMSRLGWDDDQPIEHKQVTRAIENAQKRVEAQHFEMRKQVLEFDDVLNKQRQFIYSRRRQMLSGEALSEHIREMQEQVVGYVLDRYCDEKVAAVEWDLAGLVAHIEELVGRKGVLTEAELEDLGRDAIAERLRTLLNQVYAEREEEIGSERMRVLERIVYLNFIDSKWMEHLRNMDDLREGIFLRAYAQRDPLVEYQFEAYQMFDEMMAGVREGVLKYLYRVRVVEGAPQVAQRTVDPLQAAYTNRDASAQGRKQVQQRRVQRVGRNDPCPCGSGKKYKKCHGAAG
ncbi:MAG: preprotein translocase subunit SecA [Firmicutes bacterium]|nr:preprotein translocase subunit SecA [Bacillota bacterium]